MENGTRAPDSLLESSKGLITYMMVAVCFLVVVANLLMLVTLMLNEHLRKQVNITITSLTITDLCVGISMLMNYAVQFGGLHFDKILDFLAESSIMTSSFHILLIAIDRFISIITPLTYHKCVTDTLIKIIIGCAWLVAALFSAVPLILELCCNIHIDQIISPWIHLIFLAITLGLLLSTYGYIGSIALNQMQKMKNQVVPVNQARETQRVPKATKVLTAVIGSYILLWSPYTAMLIFTLTNNTKYLSTTFNQFAVGSAISNSGVNVVIYSLMNSQFRCAVQQLLRCKTRVTETDQSLGGST